MSEIQDRLQALFPLHYRSGNTLLLNADCMKVMKHIRDGEFELACVDPPYGIGVAKNGKVGGTRKGIHKKWAGERVREYKQTDWDNATPSLLYFDEIRRTSKNQIIWGGNYFLDYLGKTSSIIIWDKQTSGNFSDGELAWSSFDTSLKIYRHLWNGFAVAEGVVDRIHPTQKPVKLYQWLLENYAKPGQRILDTHLGSGSSAIAAHYYGVDFVGGELDKDYFEAAKKRFEQQTAQLAMLGV